MSSNDYPISGACQCGQVQFTLLAPPKAVFACHCKQCQKLATSPFSVTAMVDANDIEISGQLTDWERSSDSGNRNCAKFCPSCGNRIYHFNPDQPEILKLKAGSSLDNTDIMEPTVHVWVSEKQSWYQLPEGVKAIEGQP